MPKCAIVSLPPKMPIVVPKVLKKSTFGPTIGTFLLILCISSNRLDGFTLFLSNRLDKMPLFTF